MKQLPAALSLAFAIPLLLGACTPNPDPTNTNTATETATETPSPTPTLSEEEQAIALAKEKLTEFLEMETEAFKNPAGFDLVRFEETTTPDWAPRKAQSVSGMVDRGEHMEGDPILTYPGDPIVDLTNAASTEPPVAPTVTFLVCFDVTNYRVYDKNGNDITPERRLDQSASYIRISNYSYPDPDQWRYDGELEADVALCGF